MSIICSMHWMRPGSSEKERSQHTYLCTYILPQCFCIREDGQWDSTGRLHYWFHILHFRTSGLNETLYIAFYIHGRKKKSFHSIHLEIILVTQQDVDKVRILDISFQDLYRSTADFEQISSWNEAKKLRGKTGPTPWFFTFHRSLPPFFPCSHPSQTFIHQLKLLPPVTSYEEASLAGNCWQRRRGLSILAALTSVATAESSTEP